MAGTNTYEYLRCNLNTIEEIIGYRFQDRNLLIQAFTSKSFGAENPSFEDNDVLEFYGDAELYKFLSDCCLIHSQYIQMVNVVISLRQKNQLAIFQR